jgi:hypothetical protein
MFDMSSISSVAGTLKGASDILKTAMHLRDTQAFQAKMVELNGEIMAAQSSALRAHVAQTAMVQEIGELKKQIADTEAWDREKQRYQLTDHGSGTFSYTLKEGMEQGEPPHKICAHCYQQGRKSILQFSHKNPYQQELHTCFDCGKEYRLGQWIKPSRPTVAQGFPNPHSYLNRRPW